MQYLRGATRRRHFSRLDPGSWTLLFGLKRRTGSQEALKASIFEHKQSTKPAGQRDRDIVLLSHCRDLGTAPAQRACRRRQSGVTLSHAHQSRSPISSWVTGKETVDLRRHGPGCGARRHHMLRGGSPESLRCSGSEPCARAGRRLWTQLCWGDSPLPTGVPTKGPGSKDAGSIQSSGETWASIPKQTLSKGFLFNQILF